MAYTTEQIKELVEGLTFEYMTDEMKEALLAEFPEMIRLEYAITEDLFFVKTNKWDSTKEDNTIRYLQEYFNVPELKTEFIVEIKEWGVLDRLEAAVIVAIAKKARYVKKLCSVIDKCLNRKWFSVIAETHKPRSKQRETLFFFLVQGANKKDVIEYLKMEKSEYKPYKARYPRPIIYKTSGITHIPNFDFRKPLKEQLQIMPRVDKQIIERYALPFRIKPDIREYTKFSV